MSGREERRRRRDARAYSTYDALVHTQFFEKRRRETERERDKRIEGERRRPKTCVYIRTSSPTSHRDLPIIIFFSHHTYKAISGEKKV